MSSCGCGVVNEEMPPHCNHHCFRHNSRVGCVVPGPVDLDGHAHAVELCQQVHAAKVCLVLQVVSNDLRACVRVGPGLIGGRAANG
jgi:hypothetical protein